MPMQESAVGTAAQWGLELPNNPAEWKILENFLGASLPHLLEGIIHDATNVGNEFGQVISMAGEELVGSMYREVDKLLPLLTEQTAISFLREIFGLPQPEAPLAGEVFMELARDEVAARSEMKTEANESFQLIQELRDRFILAIKLRLMTQLNEVEESLTIHEQARARTLETSQASDNLSPLVAQVDLNFTSEIKALTKKRSGLYQVINHVEAFAREVDQNLELTVLPTVRQTTAPTRIAA